MAHNEATEFVDVECNADAQRRRFRRRFGIALAFMVILNFWPMWSEALMDSSLPGPTVGFPFFFLTRGEPSGQLVFSKEVLSGDAFAAMSISWVAAHLSRDGWLNSWRRLRTWGVEDLE